MGEMLNTVKNAVQKVESQASSPSPLRRRGCSPNMTTRAYSLGRDNKGHGSPQCFPRRYSPSPRRAGVGVNVNKEKVQEILHGSPQCFPRRYSPSPSRAGVGVNVNEEKVQETLCKVETALRAVRSAVQDVHGGRRRTGPKDNTVPRQSTRHH